LRASYSKDVTRPSLSVAVRTLPTASYVDDAVLPAASVVEIKRLSASYAYAVTRPSGSVAAVRLPTAS
jgi:hypothetical protein